MTTPLREPPYLDSWRDVILYLFVQTWIARFIYFLFLVAAVVLVIVALAKKRLRKKLLIWAIILIIIGLGVPEALIFFLNY